MQTKVQNALSTPSDMDKLKNICKFITKFSLFPTYCAYIVVNLNYASLLFFVLYGPLILKNKCTGLLDTSKHTMERCKLSLYSAQLRDRAMLYPHTVVQISYSVVDNNHVFKEVLSNKTFVLLQEL